MRHHRLSIIVSVAGLWPSAALALPTSVRVVNTSAPPGGNGRSWATAYTDIQPALDEAAQPGSGVKEVWVAAGTYIPSRRTDPTDPLSATFSLISGVGVFGGFVGGETDRTQRP